MKIRNDFVTNSSSSSFILAFNNKDEGLNTIGDLTTEYGSKYVDRLLTDFSEAIPFDSSSLGLRYQREFESNAEWEIDDDYGRGWGRRPTFRREWMDSHPGATTKDYYNSEERRSKIEEYVSRCFKLLLDDIGDRIYLVELHYSDDTRLGSKLEHDILPELPFVVHTFSHH